MTIEETTTPVSLEDIPLTRVVEYLDNGEVYPLALTCSSSLAAVQAASNQQRPVGDGQVDARPVPAVPVRLRGVSGAGRGGRGSGGLPPDGTGPPEDVF